MSSCYTKYTYECNGCKFQEFNESYAVHERNYTPRFGKKKKFTSPRLLNDLYYNLFNVLYYSWGGIDDKRVAIN